MKYLYTIISFLLVLGATTKVSHASHLFGGDLRYEYISSNGDKHTYKVILIIYGDCNGSAFSLLPGSTALVTIYKNGGYYSLRPSLALTYITAQSSIEITPVCPDEAGNTACSYPSGAVLPPGVLPGIKKFTYEGTVELDGPANWQFTFTGDLGPSTAGRSNQIQNLSPVGTTSLVATLNNAKGQNSSPSFTASPTPFFCVDKEYSYALAPVDPDKDLLVLSMTSALDGATINSSYVAPYSAQRPFPCVTASFNFNTSTGQLSFIPQNPSNQPTFRSIVANKAYEIRNGDTIGTCMREMTFVFLNDCENTPPADSLTNVDNGSIIYEGIDKIIQACEGQTNTISFEVPAHDPDGDNISVSWNNLPPGARASVINDSTSDPTFRFEWNIADTTPTGEYTFFITLADDGCPLSVQKTVAKTIRILPFMGGLTPFTQAPCKSDSNGYAWLEQDPSDTNTYKLTWTDRWDYPLRTVNSSKGDTLFNLAPGEYRVTALNSSGCSKTFVIVIPEPDYRVSFSAADTIGCVGDQFIFSNNSRGEFSRFLWDYGDGTAPQPSDGNGNHIYTHSGVYTVTLSGTTPLGCHEKTTLTIYIDTIYTPAFTTDKDNICVGDYVNFYPNIGPNTVSAHWEWGKEPDYNFNREGNVHTFDKTGAHEIKLNVSYRRCPNGAYSKTVYVHPYPVVDLGSDSALCLNGRPITLQNKSSNETGSFKYKWSTGATNEQIIVREPGIYSLTMTSEQGCATTDYTSVNKSCYLDVPNSFTPNGDGQNDYFFPRQLLSKDVAGFKMQIMNRWGQLVYDTVNPNGRGWDGKYSNKEQPAGTYIYIIELIFSGGQKEKYTGNVTLLR